MIMLRWEWGFKDLVSILNMIVIGAFVASLSHMGNEPQFCNSFASGLAFRMALTLEPTRALPGYDMAQEWWAGYYGLLG